MSISLQTEVQRSGKFLHTDLADRHVILLDVDNDTYFELNEFGGRIWGLASERVALGTMVDRLLDEFEVGRAECEAEVLKFVDGLIATGMLDIA